MAKGERTLAAIHLCHAGLPRFEGDENRLKLLFLAEQLLDDGMEPGELLKGLDMLPASVSGEQWNKYVKANFNPDEPRDDHGRWTDGGDDEDSDDEEGHQESGGDDQDDGRVQVADFNTMNVSSSDTATGTGQRVDIQRADGFTETRIGGSHSWRNYNPGNIISSDFADDHGAIGDDGHFAIFPDEETGQAALRTLLVTPKYSSLSIDNAIATYAPSNENDTKNY